jgi:hypothetical protein
MAVHLPTWAARDVERLKLTADAKMRTVYRMFPSAMRQLHAKRLLTPAYNAIGALGRKVSLRWLQSCSVCVWRLWHSAAQQASMVCHQAEW